MRIELEEGGLTTYRLRNQPQKTNDRQYNDFFARKKKKREEEQYRKSLEFYKDNTVSLDDTEIKPFNYDFSNVTYNSDSILDKLPNSERELKEQIYFNNLTKDFDEKTKRYENQYANKRKTYKDIVDIINNTPNARIQYNPGYFVKAGNRLFMLEKMRDLYEKYKFGGRHELEDGGKRRIFTEADKDRRAYYRDTEGYINRLAKMYPEISEVEEYEYNEEESPREYYKRMIDELPENNLYEKLINYTDKAMANDIKYLVNRGDTFRIKSDNKNVNTLKIDKNFADSLMYNAGKYNSNRQDTIPLNVVVGIPFRESTFLNNPNYTRENYIDPIYAMSNWNHQNAPFYLMAEAREPNISRKKALGLLKKASSLVNRNPYFTAWDHYKKGMYNSGHKKQFGIKYEDAVEQEGNDILNSNEFKKYMNEQGWKQYMKGKKGK